MFLTTHATVGLIIGKYIPQPLLAFGLGFLSHLILDAIPHGTIECGDPDPVKEKKLIIKFSSYDILVMLGLLTFLTVTGSVVWTPSMIAAVLGSILMDFLWGMYYLGFKSFKPFHKLNQWCHELTGDRNFRWYFWLPQAIIFSMVALYIFKL
jgi:hypothetical protein